MALAFCLAVSPCPRALVVGPASGPPGSTHPATTTAASATPSTRSSSHEPRRAVIVAASLRPEHQLVVAAGALDRPGHPTEAEATATHGVPTPRRAQPSGWIDGSPTRWTAGVPAARLTRGASAVGGLQPEQQPLGLQPAGVAGDAAAAAEHAVAGQDDAQRVGAELAAQRVEAAGGAHHPRGDGFGQALGDRLLGLVRAGHHGLGRGGEHQPAGRAVGDGVADVALGQARAAHGRVEDAQARLHVGRRGHRISFTETVGGPAPLDAPASLVAPSSLLGPAGARPWPTSLSGSCWRRVARASLTSRLLAAWVVPRFLATSAWGRSST